MCLQPSSGQSSSSHDNDQDDNGQSEDGPNPALFLARIVFDIDQQHIWLPIDF